MKGRSIIERGGRGRCCTMSEQKDKQRGGRGWTWRQACIMEGVLRNCQVGERTTVMELRAWRITLWDGRGEVLLEG